MDDGLTSRLEWTFTPARLGEIRRQVRRQAMRNGLARPRVQDVVLSVNEALNHVAEYGSGHARVTLWRFDGHLYCEVTDSFTITRKGSGLNVHEVAGPDVPRRAGEPGGGLWLMRRLSDGVTVRTGEAGSTIRLVFALNGDATRARPLP